MQDYILGYLKNFEATLFGPQYTDPQSGWRSLANESSAIDYFLFEARVGHSPTKWLGRVSQGSPSWPV